MSVLIKPLSFSDVIVTATDITNFPDGKGSFAPFIPTSGTIQIDDEDILYTSHYMGVFRGLTRGANATVATNHLIGAAVNPFAVVE